MGYNPANWYWNVGTSTTQVYSSASQAYVPMTDAIYQAWLAAGNLPTKIDNIQDLQVVLFSAGVLTVVITSAGSPALNGNYAITPAVQANINAIVTYINLNNTFPGASGTLAWMDASGAAHEFSSTAEFKAFATAVADFVFAITLFIDSGGAIGSVPSNVINIA